MPYSSSEFSAFVLGAMSEGFVVVDRTGKYVLCNQAACDIIGLSKDEFMGRVTRDPTWKCVNEDGTPCNPDDYPSSRVLKTYQPVKNVVMGIYRKDGTLVWVMVNSVPIQREQDLHPLALTTFTDITLQVAKKKEHEERKRELIETQTVGQIGTWNYDAESRKSRWTPEMYRIFGFPISEPEPSVEEILEKIYPEDRSLWRIAMQRALQEGKAYKVKFRVNHPDKIIWVEGHGKGERSSDGKMHAYGTCQEITEKVNLEQENNFVLNSLDIGFWKWDLGSDHISWDHRMYYLYGVNQIDNLGPKEIWKRAIHPDDRERTFNELIKSVTDRKVLEHTFRILDADKNVRYISGKSVVQRDENGKPVSIYGINWDRTKEVLLEKEVQEERAKSIQTSRLASIGEMAAGVAHEINNPLTIINTAVLMLKKLVSRKTLNDEILMDSLNDIDLTVKRISQIISGLKNLSRDSSGEVASAFTLQEVLNDVLSICREKFKINGIDFRIDMKDPLIEKQIEGRRVQLSQVLLNIISNAYDAVSFVPEKWISLEVLKEEDLLKIIITDSGSGIAPEIREKIFNPFFTTKEIGKGTGLGLSLSRTLIENIRGKLYLDTTRPQTCFVIEFPLLESLELV